MKKRLHGMYRALGAWRQAYVQVVANFFLWATLVAHAQVHHQHLPLEAASSEVSSPSLPAARRQLLHSPSGQDTNTVNEEDPGRVPHKIRVIALNSP